MRVAAIFELWTTGFTSATWVLELEENTSYLLETHLTAVITPSSEVQMGSGGDNAVFGAVAGLNISKTYIAEVLHDRSTPSSVRFDVQSFPEDQNPPAVMWISDRPVVAVVVLRSLGGFQKSAGILYAL